ncbi:hypothetical protein GCM10020218_069350 [Dactylosporangium vinaceum]
MTVVSLPGERPLMVSGSHDGMVRLWDLTALEQVGLVELPGRVSALAELSGGRLAVGYGEQVAVVRLSSARTRHLRHRARQQRR